MSYKSHQTTGFKRLFLALGWSFKGLRQGFVSEAAFRQEVCLALILCPLGFWLGDNGVEKCLLISSVLLVLIVELLNSAIEAAVDRIGSDRHQLAGQAKDMGSAAVFITLLTVVITWLLILAF